MAFDALTTVDALKLWLKSNGANIGANDAELAVLIGVASDQIGRYLQRDNLAAVYTYTENYYRRGMNRRGGDWSVTLRHWPVTSIASVTMNNAIQNPLTQAEIQASQSGYYLQEDEGEPRTIKFRYLFAVWPVSVVYSAGYLPQNTPPALKQACIQYASEIFRSVEWLGVKSRVIAGETVTYDTNGTWGMSERVRLMLHPFRDVVPFRGY